MKFSTQSFFCGSPLQFNFGCGDISTAPHDAAQRQLINCLGVGGRVEGMSSTLDLVGKDVVR